MPITVTPVPGKPVLLLGAFDIASLGYVADEFFICGVSALVILAVMILTIAAVAWWRRNLPHLPRKPDSAGSVMTYCADSRMVDDFAGVILQGVVERDDGVFFDAHSIDPM